jgi:hypothetical protein
MPLGKNTRYDTSARAAVMASIWGEKGAVLEFEIDDATGQPIAAHLSRSTNGDGITLHTNGRPHFILPTYGMFGVPVNGCRAQDVEEILVSDNKIIVPIPFAFERGIVVA